MRRTLSGRSLADFLSVAAQLRALRRGMGAAESRGLHGTPLVDGLERAFSESGWRLHRVLCCLQRGTLRLEGCGLSLEGIELRIDIPLSRL